MTKQKARFRGPWRRGKLRAYDNFSTTSAQARRCGTYEYPRAGASIILWACHGTALLAETNTMRGASNLFRNPEMALSKS
jgi:hypothetical protein